MPFVGPMTLALALGILALFEEDDDATCPAGAGGACPGRTIRLFYLGLGAVRRLRPAPADHRLGHGHLDAPLLAPAGPGHPGRRADVALLRRLRRLRLLGGAHAQEGARSTSTSRASCARWPSWPRAWPAWACRSIVFLAYLLFTWNWRRLARAQLGYGVLVALLACAVVAIPWHHAMLARHGMPFWEELYGDNHWRRLVHGPPRRPRHLRVLPARAGLRRPALDRPAALGAGLGGRRAGSRTAAAAPTRGLVDPPAGDLLAGRDLVRVGLRGGLAVDDQVPPLHPAGPARPGAGAGLFPRRPPARPAGSGWRRRRR